MGCLQGNKKEMTKQFRDFESARKFVRSLNLKSKEKWVEYCKSGEKLDNIPAGPWNTYKDKGWKGMGDFLGTMAVSTNEKIFLSFKEAREFVRSLGLKGTPDWDKYCKSGNKPDNIPSNPDRSYKNKGWKGMGDWTGTGNIRNKEFRNFESARTFVRSLGLKSRKEWEEYRKSGNKPDNIPSAPGQIYKNTGWMGFGDWLGTGRIATQEKTFLSFTEAREFVRMLKLKDYKAWFEYCKSGDKPEYISAIPETIYKNDWKGIRNWLGTEWRTFNEAREFVRSLGLKSRKEWLEYCKLGDKPDDIPSSPWEVYKEWKK